ncbi:MAG: lipoprotein-releasing system ATP-binding protein LolD [Halobacteriovoraceae bacterium]|nr:lipoprotein-releasing system ATP-binding protein LolD [Peredibacter sp.]MBJ00876.1 lipoprotein-releasing system ATP-binding protein LolD [Halobacteriovoraceae bacterium]MBJ01175.1 lipoprotein-releasing system ATP-binding protein LolD [Halobacteriovoraceae bacterium]|tara:strand:+ start:17322 stop:17981 length:660 start_codon:yes stop_codon:yes gene_type:complete
MSFIECTNVQKNFGATKVLRGIDFSLEAREQVALVGASGSGKSTFLYLLGGLDTADEGVVKVNSKELSKLSDQGLANYRNNAVGFIFQFHFLLPSMNCLDNLLLPAKIGNHSIKKTKEHVLELVDRLGVSHCLKKYPYEISGGEQQRINIVRALSLKPSLLLCDEPTGNLDSKNSELVSSTLSELAKDYNSAMIVVTHDNNVASHFPRKIVIEDGRIIS